MSAWSVVAVVYGLVLAAAAIAQPIRRRLLVATACLAYALVALGLGTLTTSFWIQLWVPPALLLTGYWLSGFFFRDPQAWLESYLLRSDAAFFRLGSIESRLERAPLLALELLEASYAAVHLVIAVGAVVAAREGLAAISRYWTVILGAELACYVALPWLRSRPPRAIEPPGAMARRHVGLRRLNGAILDRAGIQANTLPSGHVAGAMAAALAILTLHSGAGAALLAVAILISVAAVAGRYHYVVDCVAGASVALLAWSLV